MFIKKIFSDSQYIMISNNVLVVLTCELTIKLSLLLILVIIPEIFILLVDFKTAGKFTITFKQKLERNGVLTYDLAY